jgi:hypothetical protein
VLVAFLLLGLAVGLLITGPRDVLRSRWPWLAAAIALALWSPYLVWQAQHGRPQLAISGAIAAGGSGTSEPRWLFLPYQVVLVSPVLMPVWVAGLRRLVTDPELRRYRAFAATYGVLAVVHRYRRQALLPDWPLPGAARGGARASAVVSAVIFLPLVPARSLADRRHQLRRRRDGGVAGAGADVASAYGALPAAERAGAVVVPRNYGQAGAIDRYRATTASRVPTAVTTATPTGDRRRTPPPPRSSSVTTRASSESGSGRSRSPAASTTRSGWRTTSRGQPSGSAAAGSLRGRGCGRT